MSTTNATDANKALVLAGIKGVCDVFGAGVSRMSSASIKEVLAQYSREGFYTALRPAGIQHLAGTRVNVLESFQASLNTTGQRPENPLDMDPLA